MLYYIFLKLDTFFLSLVKMEKLTIILNYNSYPALNL
jgi:hypothetical protein